MSFSVTVMMTNFWCSKGVFLLANFTTQTNSTSSGVISAMVLPGPIEQQAVHIDLMFSRVYL